MPKFPKGKKKTWLCRPKDSYRKGYADTPIDFYNTKKWRSLRNYYIQMNPLCKECDRHGILTPGKEVDHIIPLRLGGDPYRMNNLQSLCRSCHARKSGREGQTNKKNK
tara:strand:+ start:2188 stop:2511 length:324 start_codon:yes stop_codon:yes gene_type:complete